LTPTSNPNPHEYLTQGSSIIDTTQRKKSPGTEFSREHLNQMRQIFNNPLRVSQQPTMRYASTRRGDQKRITPKKRRQLYSSLAQPNYEVSLNSSNHRNFRRAKHSSVLNFSDGSQLRRSSIDPSIKSASVAGCDAIFTSGDSNKAIFAAGTTKVTSMTTQSSKPK
jgi:hypothetical protein